MFTDTGKLSSRELWLRVAIALTALLLVLGVGRWVFESRIHGTMIGMQAAIQKAQAQKQAREQAADRKAVMDALDGPQSLDSEDDQAFARWWQKPAECLRPADEAAFAACLKEKQAKRAEFDRFRAAGTTDHSQ